MKRLIAAAILMALTSVAFAQTQADEPPPPPELVPRPEAPAVMPVPVGQLQSEFAVAAGDTVLFAHQSTEIDPRSAKILDNQARWLKARPDLKITLEAWCDDDIDPGRAHEFCLDRARAVRDHLVRRGVKAERISPVAFDGRKTAKDEKARRTNRRVDTRISAGAGAE
jgi:outer membrane protein OmpA-like peptidoglycan-associated protein